MKAILELWKEVRTRLTNQMSSLKTEDLSKKKLGACPNSAGFLILMSLYFPSSNLHSNEFK